MFTQICNLVTAGGLLQRAVLVPLALTLAGCTGETDGTGVFPFLSAPESAGAEALEEVSLYRGEVVVAGPRGYCIDPGSLRRRSTGSFVLLASCESLTGRPGGGVAPAVMTISVLPRGKEAARRPSASDLAGNAQPIEAMDGKALSLVYLPGGSDAGLPGAHAKYWRAGMVINGHVIGLAVYGQADSVAASEDGKHMIVALARSLRQHSPVMDEVTPVTGGGGVLSWLGLDS